MREPPVREPPGKLGDPARNMVPAAVLQPSSTAWMLILALTGAGILGMVLLVSHPGATKCSTTRVEHDLRVVITVAEAIYTDTGRYPESMEAMVSLGNEEGRPAIASLEEHPKDPWGHSYVYEIRPDGSPRVTCLGSDGQSGGDGEAADTILPNEEEEP